VVTLFPIQIGWACVGNNYTIGVINIIQHGNAFGQALLIGTLAWRHFGGFGVRTSLRLGALNLFEGLHQSVL
jgi:hypothetical protein